jgi:hypothetical protein
MPSPRRNKGASHFYFRVAGEAKLFASLMSRCTYPYRRLTGKEAYPVCGEGGQPGNLPSYGGMIVLCAYHLELLLHRLDQVRPSE